MSEHVTVAITGAAFAMGAYVSRSCRVRTTASSAPRTPRNKMISRAEPPNVTLAHAAAVLDVLAAYDGPLAA